VADRRKADKAETGKLWEGPSLSLRPATGEALPPGQRKSKEMCRRDASASKKRAKKKAGTTGANQEDRGTYPPGPRNEERQPLANTHENGSEHCGLQ